MSMTEGSKSTALSCPRASARSDSAAVFHDNEPQIKVARQRLTHPDRVLYPEQGVTKRDLALFYERIANWILPHITGRPLSLVRCPRGRSKHCFFQKHGTESLPDPIRVFAVQEHGRRATYMTIRDLSGLIALVQLGVLELHPWGSREDRLDRPDRLVFDLDPSPGLEWKLVVRGARVLQNRLLDLGLKSFVKTSGGKGLHVVVPLVRRSTWDELMAFAKAVALDIARRDPEAYTAVLSKAKRKGKIFIDYLRNGRGATSVAAYSTRARAGAPISTPLRWDELDALRDAAAYTLTNLSQRLDSLHDDPWAGFFDVHQSITAGMRAQICIK